MWKLFIILLFAIVGIQGQDEDCEECNEMIDDLLADFLWPVLEYRQPFKISIPDCEHCDVDRLTNLTRNNDSCVTGEKGCREQITHFKIESAFLNCSCDLDTKSGKQRGGIHGTIEKFMFSLRLTDCPDEVHEPHLYEDGHIAGEKLDMKCDGDEDFMKACEEEEHSVNVDNVVTAVDRAILDNLMNSIWGREELTKQLKCYNF